MFSFSSSKFSIRRCKEATGRVVMFQQHGILNSFTMEATFSGTKIDQYVTSIFNMHRHGIESAVTELVSQMSPGWATY